MWDSTTKFHVEESKLPENSVTLTIQLRKKGPFCLDKDVGEIHIHLKKLFGDPKNDIVNNKRHNLGVYIVTASGTTTGYLNFSYKLSDTFEGKLVRDGVKKDVSRLRKLRSIGLESKEQLWKNGAGLGAAVLLGFV